MTIIQKIKKAGLIGRGGAEFPTYKKWEFVKKAEAKQKYVVCNASEGELGVYKDLYILRHYPDRVFEGMRLAMDYIGTKQGYINLNKEYYTKMRRMINIIVRGYKHTGYNIEIYKEDPTYIGGEETALLNAIEGKRIEPRIKPPYPAKHGLFGKPTLIHNVETLYNVSLVDKGEYEEKRFYCVTENDKEKGVYFLPDNLTVHNVLKETGNIPEYDYFVQVGGGISGTVYNAKQARRQKVHGAGSIDIYKKSIKPKDLLMKWFEFYNNESCGKCTPCRMGTYNIYQMIKKRKAVAWKEINDILKTMEQTSFCPLGRDVSHPVKSYMKNVLKK